MPLKWTRGRNPYVHSDFRILRAGPGILPAQVVHLAADLSRTLTVRHELELDGMRITTADIHEASARLRDPETLAEERLLAHAPPLSTPLCVDVAAYRQKLRQIISTLIDAGELSEWNPGRAGDAEDRRADILFDA